MSTAVFLHSSARSWETKAKRRSGLRKGSFETQAAPRPRRPVTASKDADRTVARATARIQSLWHVTPRLGIVLGSGFGAVAGLLQDACTLPYDDIPGLESPRVPGHAGILHLGRLGTTNAAVFSGRRHYYEGIPMADVVRPVHILAALGVQAVLLTNAAGGIRPAMTPGSFMILRDHINAMGINPLRECTPAGLTGFVDMTEVYDPALRKALRKAAKDLGTAIHEGVYLAVPGPSYETPAEIRAFRKLGADAVGMSTVPEAMAARQLGLRVAAVSCISNAAAGIAGRRQRISHAEVLTVARHAEDHATGLVAAFERHARRLWTP